jgi:hypothetical protein
VDYYFRIEFQHRGSPHAHMILWLANAPICDITSPESISQVEEFISQIITVDVSSNPEIEMLVQRQIHKHSHTCKKGQTGPTQCRFNIPFFPMDHCRILLPIESHVEWTDNQLHTTLQKIKEAIEVVPAEIQTFGQFLEHIEVSQERYLASIQRRLKQPKVFLQRSPQELFVNPFVPKILYCMESNMDAQFILDPFACAMYIVDYINKSNRGLSKLLRDAMAETNEGNFTIAEKLRHIGHKFINATEISAQEAAWSLLHLKMHDTSVACIHISSGPINSRVRLAKSRNQLELEQAHNPGSTDVFCSNSMDHYVQRPQELNTISLAEFVADYEYKKNPTGRPRNVDVDGEEVEVDNDDVDEGELDEFDPDNGEPFDVRQQRTGRWLSLLDRSGYIRKRQRSKIIKYRRYNFEQDAENFFREQLLLFLPFRNEREEIEDVNHADVSVFK